MRRVVAACAMAAVIASQLAAGAALAAAPDNDGLATPEPVPNLLLFEATPDMSEATLEENEPVCADVEDQGLDQSVWYRMDFDIPTDVGIEIDGPDHAVTAGVYGPFDPGDMPVSAGGLEARSCIYDTGSDSALHDTYAPGAYLVQLTRNSETPGDDLTIRISKEKVWLRPWMTGRSIAVPEGVPIDISWSWAACTADLASQAPDAIDQTYLISQSGEEVMGVGPEDARGMWSGPDPYAVEPGACRGKGMTGAAMNWSWFVDNLPAGEYQLDLSVVTSRTITDGSIAEDGHGVLRVPAGTQVFEGGAIGITVTEP
jgi:hypothetical protein